jgi:hypothetical protein
MSSRIAPGRKNEHPPAKVFSPSAPTTREAREDLILSARRSRDTPLKHTSVQRLELSNQSAQPASHPELPSQHPSTYFPPSNHVNYRYQKTPQLPPINSGVLSLDSILPGDDLPASSIQRQYSLTPSGPPEYRSTYSSLTDNGIPFAIANEFTQGDDQNASFQLSSASGSGSSQPLPQAQLTALSYDSSLPVRYFSSVPNSNQYSSTGSKRRSHERHRTSLSGPSPSTTMPNGTWPPPTPPFPIDFISGRRSSNISPVSPIVQSSNQTNHPDNRSHEGALGLSDDYRRKPSPEIFVFPPGRSAAHPEKSSKPKSPKSSLRSSKSSDDSSGGLRIIREIFKKKNKGKTTPPGTQNSDESSYDFIVHHERTRTLKSSYPLDPYNSVLLDKLRQLVFLFFYFLFNIHA